MIQWHNDPKSDTMASRGKWENEYVDIDTNTITMKLSPLYEYPLGQSEPHHQVSIWYAHDPCTHHAHMLNYVKSLPKIEDIRSYGKNFTCYYMHR